MHYFKWGVYLFGVFAAFAQARAFDVTVLTPSGSKVLKSWSIPELKLLRQNSHNRVTAQTFFIDLSTTDLPLADLADIDLLTFYGTDGRMIRVPRFMVWRGFLKIRIGTGGALHLTGDSNRLLVPNDYFTMDSIEKVELSSSKMVYAGTHLSIRTNPAASRGEKLFTQNCLACHSLPSNTKSLNPLDLSEALLKSFASKHPKLKLSQFDARAVRGLIAYREALASEKNGVKSQK